MIVSLINRYMSKPSSIIYLLLLLIIIFLNLNQLNASYSNNNNNAKQLHSMIDLYEIDNFKYDFEIGDEPIRQIDLTPASTTSHSSFVSLTSIHGQMYQCNLTDVFNTLNIEQIEKNQKENLDYNFTYIKHELDKNMKQLKDNNICITRVCFRINT